MKKTYSELKITKEEYRALKGVRKMLKAGVLKHRKEPKPKKPTSKPLFNMGVWSNKDKETLDDNTGKVWSCGTVGCIGGWMGMMYSDILFKNEDEAKNLSYDWDPSPALQNLFYPTVGLKKWSNLKTKDAIKAIDHFLKGEEFPWDWKEYEDELQD